MINLYILYIYFDTKYIFYNNLLKYIKYIK